MDRAGEWASEAAGRAVLELSRLAYLSYFIIISTYYSFLSYEFLLLTAVYQIPVCTIYVTTTYCRFISEFLYEK